MAIDPEVWPVVSRLMDEWMDLPEDRRAEWLVTVEAQHRELIPVLRGLLKEPKPDFLATLPQIDIEDGALAAGMLAGPYRLERELGRGGMGVVWLAARADGAVNRNVALKFPFVHLYDEVQRSRFAREREILARLEDARIARLYDAGISKAGRPYLVLEYVEGEPITTYSDRLNLDTRGRLALFLDVLRAVQYAHANLVVHRDLKPSNILVTRDGQVRLLDFGIAKFLEGGEAVETEVTRLEGRAMTPGYASPEQVRGEAITTAADVYSLGVLLSNLLKGQAATRGDLDNIVLKAVRDEARERYPTADAFAQDIERYLNGQPVMARPDSVWYRSRKFVLRNKLAVSAAVTVVLAVALGAGVSLWQKRRADTEAATARAVSEFLEKDLLSQAGSGSQAGQGNRPDPDIKIRTALDRAAARLDGKFSTQPSVEAAIRQTIGDTYRELGLYAESERQLNRALEVRQKVLGAAHRDTLQTMGALAETYGSEGKYPAEETLLQNLLQLERSSGRQESREAMDAAHSLASVAVLNRADYASAEVQYRQLLEVQERVLGESDTSTLATMNDLAGVFARENKAAQAEEMYRKVVEIKRRTLGEEHPSTLISMNGLGVLYRNQGKYPEAETWLKAALDGRRRAMGATHRDTLASMNGLGLLYMAEGKYAESEPLLTEAVATAGKVLGAANPDAQSCLNNLADLYAREGKWKQSAVTYQRLLEARLRTYGEDSPYTAGTRGSLGDVDLQLGDYADAGGLLQLAMDHYQKHKVDGWRRYYTECLLGACLARQGKHAEGTAMLATAYQGLLARKDSVPFEYRFYLERAANLAETTK